MKDKKADFDKENQYERQQKAYKFLVRAWNGTERLGKCYTVLRWI